MDAEVPEPTVFAPGVVSTGLRESGISFSPDGREAYFTRRARRGAALIFVSRYGESGWEEAELAPFAEEGDEAPFVTADGDALYFSSRRPIPGYWDRSENIWVVRRAGDGWAEPEPLSGTVNQPRNELEEFATGTELGAHLLPSGELMYWTRVSPDWGSDIYIADPDAEGGFVDARPLRINSVGDESYAALSPDGRFLVFQGYRSADGFGGDDLYVSERTDFGWGQPRLLPEPINSSGYDGHPSFSPNGRLFFFASDRTDRFRDIYYVDVGALGI